jgi:2-methylaconitate cis-trans-isomerase PrpF
MFSKITRVAMVAMLAAALAGTTAASAKPGDVVRSGSCSRSADWKLKLSPQDGKIEVEYEVDSNHAGQTWHVRIVKNATKIFQGARVTKAPSGSFTVRKVTSNPAGADTFTATARNAATGEHCSGLATF